MVCGHARLREITETIVVISPAFWAHDDHTEKMFAESATFLMELCFCAMFSGTPGYAMEKAYHLGSDNVQNAL